MQIIYKVYNELTEWPKNKDLRTITEDNYQKLLLALRKEGIKDPFKIGQDNIVYDGNNRLRAINELIASGVLHAENGKDLQQIPVIIENPQTEAQKVDLALTGNEQFASWNQYGLMNYLPEFENDLDMNLFNVDFFTPQSIEDQVIEKEEPQAPEGNKQPQLVQCPQCSTQFNPADNKI